MKDSKAKPTGQNALASGTRNHCLESEPHSPQGQTRNILTRLVRDECANWVGGRCMGLTVFSKPFRRSGECSIMQGKPCGYFRDAVLPLAIRRGNSRAAEKYAEIDHRAVMEDETLRLCACGAVLPLRKRLCSKCAMQNKRKSHRDNWHRQKGKTVQSQTGQLTENGNFNPLALNDL